jgi:predicted kinase
MSAKERVLIQMSGAPGAGKSTIAEAIAPQIGAIIIDHDITKSTLLKAHLPDAIAGKASYLVLGALAQDLLRQGFNVILDSPCFYDELLARGQQIAREAKSQYLYIECIVENLNELDLRLRNRNRRSSQVAGIQRSAEESMGDERFIEARVFEDWVANMKRPAREYLRLDTSQPLETSIDQAMQYIKKHLW